MLDLSYLIRHAFIRRSLSHYTDSLTSTTQDHSQITSQGTQKDIYWESVPITRRSAYTHSKKLTKAIRMIQSAKFFGNERVRLFQRKWICKGNRFPVLVHLYGDKYKGLELSGRQLWLRDWTCPSSSLRPWPMRRLLWLTNVPQMFCNIHTTNCHTDKWQYAEVWN